MKNIFLGILLLTQYSIVSGQYTYFNLRHNFDLYDVGYSIQPVDSGYVVINVSLDYNLTGGQNTRTNFILLDSSGNVVWQKVYAHPLAHYYGGGPGSLIKTSDGGFALGGGFSDTSGNNNAMLYRFNSIGDTLWTRKYGDAS